MSILGYSSSYFLPEYWANTPLYGEKIIPLIDYILSNDFTESDKLAGAFYDLANKYKNTPNLPLDKIEAIIEESGYGYIRDLLGRDEDSIRLLVSLLVLIHDLKGSGIGIEVVLNLLQGNAKGMVLGIAGKPTLSKGNILSNITTSNYAYLTGFSPKDDSFELKFKFRTSDNFNNSQCISSAGNFTYALTIGTDRKLHLFLGNNQENWNIVHNAIGDNFLLQANTTYYVKLSFDGSLYTVSYSLDDKKYESCIEVYSKEALNKESEIVYMGVNRSEGAPFHPFKGSIDLGLIVLNVDTITVEEWFEHIPVEEENTYSVRAELDITLISSDFFEKFFTFACKYVYPTLKRFEARFTLESNITVLPYTYQRMKYIAANGQNPSLDPYIRVDSIEILKNYRYPRSVKYLTILEGEELLSEGLIQTLTNYTALGFRYEVSYEIPETLEGRTDLTVHLPENFEGYITNDLTQPPTVLYDLPFTYYSIEDQVNRIAGTTGISPVDLTYTYEDIEDDFDYILDIEEL